ncbi:MAG TPA: hypothetical protein VFD85_07605 [Gemmatimonadales bacterium]|nr:hypothetical protein [Gemmatimonadales bacterium]
MRNLIAVLVLCAACSAGPRASQHPLSLVAGGAMVEIELIKVDRGVGVGGRLISGELLSVTDSGLWVLADSQPSWVAYALIHQAVFDQTGDDDLAGPEAPSLKARNRLRLESRFPQGISPELMRKLLTTYGDSVARVVRP